MSRYLLVFAVAVGSSASAGDKKVLDPRISAALACTQQQDDAARLQCFDQAMAGLRKAADAGSLTVGQAGPGDPTKMDGVIKAAAESGFNRFWIQLDSGDRWELIGTGNSVLPKAGSEVKIKRGAVGNFWLTEVGRQSFRARFLGRRSNS